MNETKPCEHCRGPVEQPTTGRPRRYCGNPCKRAAFKARHTPEPAEPFESPEVATPPAPEAIEDESAEEAEDESAEEAEDETSERAVGWAGDLDSLSLVDLRNLAELYGISIEGDREAVIQRFLDRYGEDDDDLLDARDLEYESIGDLELEAEVIPPPPPPQRWRHPTEPERPESKAAARRRRRDAQNKRTTEKLSQGRPW